VTGYSAIAPGTDLSQHACVLVRVHDAVIGGGRPPVRPRCRRTFVVSEVHGAARARPAGPRSPPEEHAMTRPPLPPFNQETAKQKVRLAEDAWNTRDPQKVASAYTVDSRWRNRAEFVNGRDEIVAFLTRKWRRELEYRLIKEMWAFEGNRIAVRFAYESHDDSGNWSRSYGNENWEFDESGLMRRRHASINDLAITEDERLFRWPQGRRPDDHPGLSDLGL
jgi:nuclear transport factor 2 (NTF2) superfamily protein